MTNISGSYPTAQYFYKIGALNIILERRKGAKAAIVRTLRATMWMLRAIVRTLRVTMWMLRAITHDRWVG